MIFFFKKRFEEKFKEKYVAVLKLLFFNIKLKKSILYYKYRLELKRSFVWVIRNIFFNLWLNRRNILFKNLYKRVVWAIKLKSRKRWRRVRRQRIRLILMNKKVYGPRRSPKEFFRFMGRLFRRRLLKRR